MATGSGESHEARELSLVAKVEMRLALAETDTKLESLLKTYLAPLLLKLASPYVAVRNKVSNSSTLATLHPRSGIPIHSIRVADSNILRS